jgi:hypothetical protein
MASEILKRHLKRFTEDLFAKYGRTNKRSLTAIGAEHYSIRKVDHSGAPPQPLAPKLNEELIKIGALGTKGFDNYIGCCCEVRASNRIIMKRPSTPIKDIIFTAAIRPRTGQIIRRCKNCRQVFGNGI